MSVYLTATHVTARLAGFFAERGVGVVSVHTSPPFEGSIGTAVDVALVLDGRPVVRARAGTNDISSYVTINCAAVDLSVLGLGGTPEAAVAQAMDRAAVLLEIAARNGHVVTIQPSGASHAHAGEG